MSDEWEVFTRYHHKADKKWAHVPSVTLLQKGDLSLNEKARQLLGNPIYVSLAYDRTRQIIRIAAMSEHTTQSTPIRKGAGKSFVVAAVAFTRYFGISVGTVRKYEAEARDGILYVSLAEPVEPV